MSEVLEKSIMRLELSQLCFVIATYWVTFIVLESIVTMIFLPTALVVPLAYSAFPYMILRIAVIALARALMESKKGYGRFYLASVAAKAMKEEENKLVIALAVITALFLYLAVMSQGETSLYFGLAALISANAGVYSWFITPKEVSYWASISTLLSIPYALFELYLTGPSPIHIFVAMMATDLLAILGTVTMGVKACSIAQR